MAQSLLSKVKTLISANLHSLLDRALQTNSLAVFDEYIREAQHSMETLKSALVDLSVTVKTLRKRYDESADEAAQLDLQIDAALKANKTVLAKVLQGKLNNELEIARSYKEQYEKQSTTNTTLTDVVTVLQAKVETLQRQRTQVATFLELIRSKNIIVKSVKDVQSISDTHTKAIFDDVQHQLDVADSQLEVSTSRLSMQIDNEIGDATLNGQLEQRRQRLGLT